MSVTPCHMYKIFNVDFYLFGGPFPVILESCYRLCAQGSSQTGPGIQEVPGNQSQTSCVQSALSPLISFQPFNLDFKGHVASLLTEARYSLKNLGTYNLPYLSQKQLDFKLPLPLFQIISLIKMNILILSVLLIIAKV